MATDVQQHMRCRKTLLALWITSQASCREGKVVAGIARLQRKGNNSEVPIAIAPRCPAHTQSGGGCCTKVGLHSSSVLQFALLRRVFCLLSIDVCLPSHFKYQMHHQNLSQTPHRLADAIPNAAQRLSCLPCWQLPMSQQALLRLQVLETLRSSPRLWYLVALWPLTTQEREFRALQYTKHCAVSWPQRQHPSVRHCVPCL